MNWTKKYFIYFCCITCSATAQSITVDDLYSQNLVDLLTNNSSCANTSAASASGDSFQVLEIVMVILVPERVVSFSEGVLLSTWSSENQKVHL
jgi:hypothetical protein